MTNGSDGILQGHWKISLQRHYGLIGKGCGLDKEAHEVTGVRERDWFIQLNRNLHVERVSQVSTVRTLILHIQIILVKDQRENANRFNTPSLHTHTPHTHTHTPSLLTHNHTHTPHTHTLTPPSPFLSMTAPSLSVILALPSVVLGAVENWTPSLVHEMTMESLN